MVKNGGVLSSIDPENGEVIHRTRIRNFSGDIFASPMAADNKIYIVNSPGRVAVVTAERQWETLQVNNLGEPAWATPAIVDGTILVRTETTLWAFRLSE